MRRRNLRLIASSDDDEEPEIPTSSRDFVEILTPTPPNPNLNTLDISDDDFVDVPDILSPPSMSPPVAGGTLDRPIEDFLRRLGVRPRREWLDCCLSTLARTLPGFENLDVAGKSKLCFAKFLNSDMNFSGGGILPDNVHAMHYVELAGPFVLQVDEIVNISSPLRDRYHAVAAGFKRCLKLSMTDGNQRVFGMEYRHIRALEVLSPSGLKVCIRNVQIRRGLVMLLPEILEVLGGSVDDLEAARQKLVEEVNKPPRGKRTRTGEVPSLATRARLAAWGSNAANESSQTNFQTARGSNPPEPEDQVPTSFISGNDAGGRTSESIAVQNSGLDVEATLVSSGSDAEGRTRERFDVPYTRLRDDSNLFSYGSNTGGRTREGFVVPSSAPSVEANQFSSTISVNNNCGRTEGFSTSSFMPDFEPKRFPSSISNCASAATPVINEIGRSEGFAAPSFIPDAKSSPVSRTVLTGTSSATISLPDSGSCRPSSEPCLSSNAVSDAENIHNIGKMDHPLILRGDKEIPFTYLACMYAEWTAKNCTQSVRGKIKCFLTGVKGFQYRQRNTFELHVYVDDGSLISEVLIDHKVVHKRIGHSPEEVTAALSSSNKQIVADMKEKMKQYQLFLANFEGTMLVEINAHSSVPVVLEMNQGCPASDAWLLLRRLKSFTAPSLQRNRLNPIDLSP